MRKLVLFDVDNTIIKGNLTTMICSKAIQSSPFNYLTWITLIFEANQLLHRHFLEQIEHSLITQNLVQLDKNVQSYANQCYQALFRTLQKAKIGPEELIKTAEQFCAPPDFIEKICYQKALLTIEAALKKPETTVVFLSGGLTLFLDIFVKKLNHYFQNKKANSSSIIAFGSTLHDDGTQNILVGSKKSILILKEIEQIDNFAQIGSVYSDNRYFADLPLLQLTRENAIIIDEKSIWYDLLAQEILSSLQFDSKWQDS